MADLARKIRNNRWYWDENTAVPSDPIADLSTTDNALSVWAVNDDRSNIDDIVVALAVPSQKLDKVDLAFLPESSIADMGLQVNESPGNTALIDARSYHRDVTTLSADDLIAVAKLIRSEERNVSFPRPIVIGLVAAAIASERIELSNLQPRAQETVAKRLRNQDK